MKKQADEAAAALAAENEKKAVVESLLVKTGLSRSEILTAYDKFYSKYPGGEITKKQFLEESSVRTRTRLNSKVFSLERLWTLKLNFGPFYLKDRSRCGA